jgi:Holliday junction DNA helicase RuvA
VLLEVAGVGYLCGVTASAFAELEPGSPAFLHVHHHIREDAEQLYGFLDRNEKALFVDLLGAHGVGPAMAMAILSTYSPVALTTVVASGDIGALTVVPGVGKKTAERLMIELKTRLAGRDVGQVDVSGGVTSATADVREALSALGYSPDEIRDTMRQLGTASDSESMLRDALALLGARRAG